MEPKMSLDKTKQCARLLDAWIMVVNNSLCKVKECSRFGVIYSIRIGVVVLRTLWGLCSTVAISQALHHLEFGGLAGNDPYVLLWIVSSLSSLEKISFGRSCRPLTTMVKFCELERSKEGHECMKLCEEVSSIGSASKFTSPKMQNWNIQK